MRLNLVDKILAKFEFGLTEAQQEYIEDNINSPTPFTPLNLANELFCPVKTNEKWKASESEVDSVKKLISKIKRGTYCSNLSQKDIDFVKNQGLRMSSIDMARAIFPERAAEIKPLSTETKEIDRLFKALKAKFNLGNKPPPPEGSTEEDDFEDETFSRKDYQPPKAISVLCAKINKANINANYDKNKLTPAQQKNIQALRGYLSTHRFSVTINIIRSPDKRQLFESEFILGTYDKSDMNSEEINMFMNLCNDYVLMANIQEQMHALNDMIDEATDGDSDKQLKVSLADTFSAKITEYNQCQARMKSLQESLSSKRSLRLRDMADSSESLTKLVEMWKSEEERKKALRIAMARNLELENEINKVSSASEYISNIFGISKDEILHN